MSLNSFILIGDVHGCFDQLDKMLSQSEFFSSRVPVFLGDYVDIGSNSNKVIALLAMFRKVVGHSIFLSGNHDYEMLRFLKEGDFVRYAKLGGTATIASYCGDVGGDVLENFRRSVPMTHIRFLQNLGVFYETDEYLFSHTGFSPSNPDDRSVEAMVFGSYSKILEPNVEVPKTTICGHYFQSSFLPLIRERIICVDTGCGVLQGPLTALLLPERTFIQISKDLSVRYFDTSNAEA